MDPSCQESDHVIPNYGSQDHIIHKITGEQNIHKNTGEQNIQRCHKNLKIYAFTVVSTLLLFVGVYYLRGVGFTTTSSMYSSSISSTESISGYVIGKEISFYPGSEWVLYFEENTYHADEMFCSNYTGNWPTTCNTNLTLVTEDYQVGNYTAFEDDQYLKLNLIATSAAGSGSIIETFWTLNSSLVQWESFDIYSEAWVPTTGTGILSFKLSTITVPDE